MNRRRVHRFLQLQVDSGLVHCDSSDRRRHRCVGSGDHRGGNGRFHDWNRRQRVFIGGRKRDGATRRARQNGELLAHHEEEKRTEKQINAKLKRKRCQRLRQIAGLRLFVTIKIRNRSGIRVCDRFHWKKHRCLRITAGIERYVFENPAEIEGWHEGGACSGGFIGLGARDEERINEFVGVGKRRFGDLKGFERARSAFFESM